MRKCQVRELGRVNYAEALRMQRELVEARKAGTIPDQLLLLEHPHVITMGRNGKMENLLASGEVMARAGIAFHPIDRGGDVTYHGPGQLVGYPILDLREWKRDVGAYVRAIEQTIIDTLADYGVSAERVPKLTGVWVDGRKIAAIGVHHQPMGDFARICAERLDRPQLFPVHCSLRAYQARDFARAPGRARRRGGSGGQTGRAFRPDS